MEAPEPIGPVFIVSNGQSVVALDFVPTEDDMRRHIRRRFGEDAELSVAPGSRSFAAPVAAYFAGDMTTFDTVPTEAAGSDFQATVWKALREIPPGETWSYAQLARHIGRPSAVRAVGHANGRNPVNLIVPCHRVIGSTGALTGYGPGIERKRWLLEFEARHTRWFR